jgi:hypothetical protein
MNRLIKEAVARPTGVMKPCNSVVSIGSFENVDTTRTAYGEITERLLEIRIACSYFLGRGDDFRATKLAEKSLMNYIYGDVNQLLDELRLLIHNQKTELAMVVVDKIESITTVT